MIIRFVQSFSRWLPRETAEARDDAFDWRDSDASWHNSSHALAEGLEVTELFAEAPAREAPPLFPDTMPAFHFPPLPATLSPHP
jgi:hypothetical protein